jgi:hypothetical protein
VAGAVVAALAVVVVLVARGGPALSDLRVETTSDDESPCSAVPLTVSLTVDDGQRVTFHWRSGAADIAEPQTLLLGAGPQSVELRPQLDVPADGVDVPLTLVAQPDDGDPATAHLTVRCHQQETR